MALCMRQTSSSDHEALTDWSMDWNEDVLDSAQDGKNGRLCGLS